MENQFSTFEIFFYLKIFPPVRTSNETYLGAKYGDEHVYYSSFRESFPWNSHPGDAQSADRESWSDTSTRINTVKR